MQTGSRPKGPPAPSGAQHSPKGVEQPQPDVHGRPPRASAQCCAKSTRRTRAAGRLGPPSARRIETLPARSVVDGDEEMVDVPSEGGCKGRGPRGMPRRPAA
eukprot:3714127-Alexandrium_andersonii.AAC.1